MNQDIRDSDNPFGVLDFLSWDHAKVGFHYQKDDVEKAVMLMSEAGVGFLRFDFLWEDIETERDRFVFDKYDYLVDCVFRHGIKIHGSLVYNPSWSGAHWNQAPSPVRYGQYARAVVSHFKERVRHWQIWHEPDNPMFWQPQDQMEKYVELLRHTYPLLKDVDPTCIIHLGGMTHALPMSLKQVYDRDGQGFFDVVNIHPFVNPSAPDAMGSFRFLHETIRGVMEDYDDGEKPIWFTEVGCPGMQDPKASPNWWLGSNLTEEQQADWVRQLFGTPLAMEGVQKIFWCFFRDTQSHFKSGSDYDGLIRHDFTKKPSFSAYQDAFRRFYSNASLGVR